MAKGVHGAAIEDVIALLTAAAASESARAQAALDAANVSSEASAYVARLQESLASDDDEWKKYIPGRPVLNGFARRAGMSQGRMQKLYLSVARNAKPDPFHEIIAIFESFASAEAGGT